MNSHGYIIVSSGKSTLSLNNFNFFDEASVINKKGVNKNLEIMKKDFHRGRNGYIKLNAIEKNNYFIYYAKLNYDNWWMINAVTDTSIKNSYKNIIYPVTTFNLLIILMIIMVFTIRFIKDKKNYENLKAIAHTELVTEGKNDIFLRNNISNFINEKYYFAFISLEVINIKNIVTILGLKNTELDGINTKV